MAKNASQEPGGSKWEPAWSTTQNRWFYRDCTNGISSWTKPEGCTIELPSKPPSNEVGSRPGADEDPLPPGWEAEWDVTNCRTYYFNRSTGERQWTRPQVMDQEDHDHEDVAQSERRPLLEDRGDPGQGDALVAAKVEGNEAQSGIATAPQADAARQPETKSKSWFNDTRGRDGGRPTNSWFDDPRGKMGPRPAPDDYKAREPEKKPERLRDIAPPWKKGSAAPEEVQRFRQMQMEQMKRGPPKDHEIPPGWGFHTDRRGRYYWYNFAGERQWDKPPMPNPEADKWGLGYDRDAKQWFFHDRANGVTSWTKPGACPLEIPMDKLPKDPDRDVPPGWQVAWDFNVNRIYYFNHERAESRWWNPGRPEDGPATSWPDYDEREDDDEWFGDLSAPTAEPPPAPAAEGKSPAKATAEEEPLLQQATAAVRGEPKATPEAAAPAADKQREQGRSISVITDEAEEPSVDEDAPDRPDWVQLWCGDTKQWYYLECATGNKSDKPPEDGTTLEGEDGCEGGLPPHWSSAWDDNHSHRYYFNRETKERQWERPQLGEGKPPEEKKQDEARQPARQPEVPPVAVGVPADKPGGDEEALPPHWSSAYDDNHGQRYYYNRQTKERQWERPRLEDAVWQPSRQPEALPVATSDRLPGAGPRGLENQAARPQEEGPGARSRGEEGPRGEATAERGAAGRPGSVKETKFYKEGSDQQVPTADRQAPPVPPNSGTLPDDPVARKRENLVRMLEAVPDLAKRKEIMQEIFDTRREEGTSQLTDADVRDPRAYIDDLYREDGGSVPGSMPSGERPMPLP